MKELLGRYRLLRQIAIGGTAEVYLAEDTEATSETPLVIKRLLPHLKPHAEAIALFLRDAKLALKCAHPNVRRVYGFGQIDADYFIVMEYVIGVDLGDLLDHQVRSGSATLPLGVTVRILLDTCAALDHVHALDIVHGDIGPRNLLISADGAAKLCDFGVAVEGGADTAVRGTWAYMAPERIRGEPVDPRADVFSIGVLLWELCTGRRLFKRDLPPQTMFAVVEETAPPLPLAAVDAIAARALAKMPADRYPSCAALAADLDAAADTMGLDRTASAVAALVKASLASA